MGAVIGLAEKEKINDNELMKRLAGTESISDNDPYWNKLFSFNFHVPQWDRNAHGHFVESTDPLLQSLLYNAPVSGNFAALIRVFLRRCGELDASAKCENKIFLWQTANSLILLRYICVFFAQRLGATEFLYIFEDQSPHSDRDEDDDEENDYRPLTLAEELREASSMALAADEINGDAIESSSEEFRPYAEQFLRALVDILCLTPVNSLTASVHAETIRVMLALLSTQLYADDVTPNAPFLQLFMQCRDRTTSLVRVLLQNFLDETGELPDETRKRKPESLVLSLASSMWSVFQRSVFIASDAADAADEEAARRGSTSTGDQFVGTIVGADFPPQTLAALSVALLLHLVCYPLADCSTNDKSGGGGGAGGANSAINPYKQCLALFQNAQEVSSLANLDASFKLDFTALYNRLCERVDVGDPLAILLLYMLLHRNCGFRNFVLSRINLENLVVPCLKALNAGVVPRHVASTATFRVVSHHIYLALIVMLILSEDDFFCKIVHETKLYNVSWYQADRPISEISLGGLIVLVFVKLIHINTIKTRDRYLHTNTMAALANMSAYFKHLSPFVCQKLLGLLETMTKRQSKLIHQIVEHAANSPHNGAAASNEAMQEAESALLYDEHRESLNQDVSVLEEGIRNILEILNACLANNLRTNTDLIYGILYKRELFELYRNHPFFEDLVWNIYAVINHFAGKIEAHCTEHSAQIPSTPTPFGQSARLAGPSAPHAAAIIGPTGPIVSVSSVMETIHKAAVEWPTDRLRKLPEHKFKYIEDENTVDFFVPYIWRLVNANALILFQPTAIRLHNVILDLHQYNARHHHSQQQQHQASRLADEDYRGGVTEKKPSSSLASQSQ